MILRICEFLISSVNTSPAGTNTFGAAVSCLASDFASACFGAAAGVKFSISLFTIRPFSPEPFTCVN